MVNLLGLTDRFFFFTLKIFSVGVPLNDYALFWASSSPLWLFDVVRTWWCRAHSASTFFSGLEPLSECVYCCSLKTEEEVKYFFF